MFFNFDIHIYFKDSLIYMSKYLTDEYDENNILFK